MSKMVFPTVDQLIAVLQKKGYAVFTNGSFNLNIVGIRSSRAATNKFTDTLCVFYKDAGVWRIHRYPCTTAPGWYYLENGLAKGTAILKPGQYRGAFKRGLHKGQYTALVQNKPLTVYRDRNRDHTLDYENPDTGMFGINIHRATANGVSSQVNNWSAGCTVIASSNDFSDFMNLTRIQESMGLGNMFTYTLIEEADFYDD